MSTATTLTQCRGLEKSIFTLTENGVQVRHERINQGGTHVVPYTAIPHTPNETTTFSEWIWVPAIILTLLVFGAGAAFLKPSASDPDAVSGLIFLFFIIAGVFFYILSLGFRKRVYVFADDSYKLTFDTQLPSPREVTDFIEKMGDAKNAYFERHLRHALISDPSINVKLAIVSLLHGRYITEAQAERLKKAFELTNNPADGFGFAPRRITRTA